LYELSLYEPVKIGTFTVDFFKTENIKVKSWRSVVSILSQVARLSKPDYYEHELQAHIE